MVYSQPGYYNQLAYRCIGCGTIATFAYTDYPLYLQCINSLYGYICKPWRCYECGSMTEPLGVQLVVDHPKALFQENNINAVPYGIPNYLDMVRVILVV